MHVLLISLWTLWTRLVLITLMLWTSNYCPWVFQDVEYNWQVLIFCVALMTEFMWMIFSKKDLMVRYYTWKRSYFFFIKIYVFYFRYPSYRKYLYYIIWISWYCMSNHKLFDSCIQAQHIRSQFLIFVTEEKGQQLRTWWILANMTITIKFSSTF